MSRRNPQRRIFRARGSIPYLSIPLPVPAKVSVETRVWTASRQQRLVAARLDDASVIDDEDLVGVSDRRKPVSDDDRRPAFREPAESFLQGPLGGRVHSACRLIQYEDRRIGEECPDVADHLAFAVA